MKRKLRKILCVVMSSAMVISLAACSQSPTTTSSNQSGSTASVGTQAKQVKLTLWDINSAETDPKYKPRQAALEELKKQMPNVTVETSYFQDAAYATKLPVAAASGELPDIFFDWAGGRTQPLADAGNLLDLTPYESQLKGEILPSAITNCYYGGKLMTVPSVIQVGMMYYNKDIFDKNGVAIPETWSQLTAAIKTLKAKGVVPMALGAKDLWPGCYLQNGLAARLVGVDTMTKTLKGQASFETPEIIQSAQMMIDLTNNGAFAPNVMGVDWNEAYQQFLQGKTAMTFNGSWISGMLQNDKVAFNVVVKNMPAVDGSKADQNTFVGGSGDLYMINSKTADKDTAVKFLEGLMKNYLKHQSEDAGAISGWKLDNVDSSKIGPIVKQQNSLIETATGFGPVWDTTLAAKAADTHHNLVSELIAKKITAQEFAKQSQQAVASK